MSSSLNRSTADSKVDDLTLEQELQTRMVAKCNEMIIKNDSLLNQSIDTSIIKRMSIDHKGSDHTFHHKEETDNGHTVDMI